MKIRLLIILSAIGVLLSLRFIHETSVPFNYPSNWPEPTYNFESNPLTKDGIALGRKLFYDPKLSADSMVSCASCHLSFTGFTHIDHRVSHGIYDRVGTRNTGALVNLAWQKSFMWDGSINHLDFQPLAPLTNPLEMDGNLDSIKHYLSNTPRYQSMFKKAFGDTAQVNIPNMLKAFSQFMLQMNSFDSKYDRVMKGEEEFGILEKQGYEVFKKHCASCHTEPLFTNQGFANNGLPVNPKYNDGGRIKVTGELSDSLKFRVPSLRNIAVTYPYMHDGRFKSIQMVLHHYGHNVQHTINLADELKEPLNLTEDDKRSLVFFLKTLTDNKFLYNKNLAFPR